MNATQLTGKPTEGAFRLLAYAQYMVQAAQSETARHLFAIYVQQEAKWLNKQEIRMKATIDQETCTGCGLCPEICPEVFEMKSDTARVKAGTVPAAVEVACREAMQSCPVGAISIET